MWKRGRRGGDDAFTRRQRNARGWDLPFLRRLRQVDKGLEGGVRVLGVGVDAHAADPGEVGAVDRPLRQQEALDALAFGLVVGGFSSGAKLLTAMESTSLGRGR